MKKFCILFLLCAPFGLFAERFVYNYAPGDSYRILSLVEEDVYINRRYHHSAEIVNRISVKVESADKDAARHRAVFVTSEKASVSGDSAQSRVANVFTWGTEYISEFARDKFGVYSISDEYFMPVVRNVPVFPDKDLTPGDSWQAPGEEAHDLRRGFGLREPFKIPFDAYYTYIGKERVDQKDYYLITAEYTLFYDCPEPADKTALQDYPASVMGYSKQKIYWDMDAGMPGFYTEDFRIIMNLASGTVTEFRGRARADVTEKNLDRNSVETAVRSAIERLGVENAYVTSDDRGITISLENIQFRADSAELLPSEKVKLDKIAEILKAYPDNDLLITGHTALAGTAGARQRLSQERAAAVAEYFTAKQIRESHRIFARGVGAEQPVADNSTEEGMAKNRRVEITILEN